jgi:DNA mismatch endonuclease (patch repair protein)
MKRTVVATSAERSALMKRVRRNRTAPEDEVAALLRGLSIHYRRNVSSLPGSPDFSNRRARWAIFVNGCFWHRHTACRRSKVPRTNQDFWDEKFKANRRRDAAKVVALRRLGFRVFVIWECASAAQTITRLHKGIVTRI